MVVPAFALAASIWHCKPWAHFPNVSPHRSPAPRAQTLQQLRRKKGRWNQLSWNQVRKMLFRKMHDPFPFASLYSLMWSANMRMMNGKDRRLSAKQRKTLRVVCISVRLSLLVHKHLKNFNKRSWSDKLIAFSKSEFIYVSPGLVKRHINSNA